MFNEEIEDNLEVDNKTFENERCPYVEEQSR